MMGRVDGKVAIVTGGALGIGQATAILLAKEGAKVALTDVLDEEGQQVVDKHSEGLVRYWHLDVSQEQQVKSVFAEVVAALGGIDILVNNAGISGINKPTHEVTEADWDRVMAINVKGVFFCTKHAVPYMMKAGGGSIINMSSIYGLIGAPDVPPYHASKGKPSG
jgi:NAD(P)-dependent dehydrogenase (short-subunit alcohol dehydrogenase family)